VAQSLYIHIPFCRSKCFYCSFDSWAERDRLIDPYIASLSREAASYQGIPFETVYIGGGTPTHLLVEQLERLFEALYSSAVIVRGAEVTVEVNPASCDAAKAAFLKRRGVNRVSLGVESLNDDNLLWLGRPHSAEDARASFVILRDAGFENINVDLIYGLPAQKKNEALRDVDELLRLGSEHVSLYTLSVESGSIFYDQEIALMPSEEQAEIYEAVADALVAKGMVHYEVSNFAKPGFECRHNMNYWRGHSYVGLGAAAHSHQDGVRSRNVSEIERYISMMDATGSARISEEKLGTSERAMETLLIGLRMTEGVDLSELEGWLRWSLPEEKKVLIRELVSSGFLEQKGPRLKATRKGLLVLDEISARLI
jgi:oxygen-independent coproporphyrinogen-3 oxidase